jgi:hypothetical protein
LIDGINKIRYKAQDSGCKGERDKGLKDRRCEVERVRRWIRAEAVRVGRREVEM